MEIRIEDEKKCFLCQVEGNLLYSGLTDRLYGVDGSWNFYYCEDCKLVWINPRPIIDDVNKLYKEYHTHKLRKDKRNSGIKNRIKASVLEEKYGYTDISSPKIPFGKFITRLSLLQDLVGSQIMMLDQNIRGRLLDIGAGNGFFLNQMRELGWEVVGIEQDPVAASLAGKEYGISVFSGSLDDFPIEAEAFDVVTMDHVIEHLHDPMKSLEKVYKILKPGGYFALLTPNIESYGHIKFTDSWLHLDPPRHIYLYCIESIHKLINEIGFQLINSRTLSSSAWWVWIASNVIKRFGKIEGGDLSIQDLNFISKLRGMSFELMEEILRLNSDQKNHGEEIYILAQKPFKNFDLIQ